MQCSDADLLCAAGPAVARESCTSLLGHDAVQDREFALLRWLLAFQLPDPWFNRYCSTPGGEGARPRD